MATGSVLVAILESKMAARGALRLEQFQQSVFLFIPYLLSSLKVYVNISPGQPPERPGFQQTVECG